MKNLLIAIVVCLVVWGVVYEYRQRRVDHILSSGDTISPDGSAPSSGASAAGDIPPQPVDQQAQQAQQTQAAKQMVTPAPVPAPAPAPATPAAAPAPVAQATPATAPEPRQVRVNSAADTIAPNPPNGTAFSGTGKFQVYRQGNLTWRLNTDTGQTCILFATDAEWRKPRVYERGCTQS